MLLISRGSEWHRWEPHIHASGTILNNQFGSGDPWETYLSKLESLSPKIEAIGVTDYYVTDIYEEFLRQKATGRLPNVLLFPNIEMRLDVAAKSGFVNIHLLVSPEDANHLSEVNRILKRLQFVAFDDRFDCTREELIKLGKRANPLIVDDRAALAHGATPFANPVSTQQAAPMSASNLPVGNAFAGYFACRDRRCGPGLARRCR